MLQDASLKRFGRLSVCLLVCSLFVSAGHTADLTAINAAFDRGVKNFESGNFEQSVLDFEEVLRLRPDAETALKLRDKVGHRFFVKMLIAGVEEDEKLNVVARRLLELTARASELKSAQDETIQALVDDIGKDLETRWRAIENLSTIGEPAVPYLLPKLGNMRDDALRANTIITLTKMGKAAALPIIEALDSGDVMTRQNAAIVLGNIRETRALAALKRILESSSTVPELRKTVQEAVMRITGQPVEQLPSAGELYRDLAYKYYMEDPSVMIPGSSENRIIWKWDGKGVAHKRVPSYAYNELLAEEACYDALHLDPNNADVLPLTLCVYFAQLNEVKELLRMAKLQAGHDAVPEQEAAELEQRLKDLQNIRLFAAFGGVQCYDMALGIALESRDEAVAISCIEALGRLADGHTWNLNGTSLQKSLDYPDKRVQYAAAMAVAAINPRLPFAGSENVVPILSAAMGESGVRVVLVIDADVEHLNRIKGLLRDLRCVVVDAQTGFEGLNRAKRFPAEDLILIAATLPDREPQDLVLALRSDFRTRHTPIYVMADLTKQTNLNQLYGDTANGFLDYMADKDGLAGVLEEAFSSEQAKLDSKSQATTIAYKAAVTLAGLPRQDSQINLDGATNALISSLTMHPDDVRLPALDAIRNIGTAEASDPVIAVYTDPESSKDIRVGCLKALSGILARRGSASEQEFALLLEALNDEDEDIQAAAAKALGRAGSLGIPNLHALFTNQRIGLALPPMSDQAAPAVEEKATAGADEETET